jgi:pimeloyl-ACP methyl ester carboxylesterase
MIREYAESITASTSDGKVALTWSPEWEAQIFRTLYLQPWGLPRKLKTPTLILRGTLTDTFTTGSAMAFQLLNQRPKQVIIEGAGHLVPQDQPEAVGQQILSFLKQDGI